jgi:hypothetical protein
MINILPTFKSIKKIEEKRKKDSEWNFENANPATARISKMLEEIITKTQTDYSTPVYSENILPVSEPNVRHVNRKTLADLDTTLLCKSERDIIVEKQISYNVSSAVVNKTHRNSVSNLKNVLALRLVNSLPTAIDLFIQKDTSIQNSFIYPNDITLRYLFIFVSNSVI